MVIKNRSQNQRSDFKSTIKNVEHSISLQNMSALEQTSFDVIFQINVLRPNSRCINQRINTRRWCINDCINRAFAQVLPPKIPIKGIFKKELNNSIEFILYTSRPLQFSFQNFLPVSFDSCDMLPNKSNKWVIALMVKDQLRRKP